MARHKQEVTVKDVIPPMTKAQELAHIKSQNEQIERQAMVIKRFGDGLPFDENRYQAKIRDHLSRSAGEMLAAGSALIVVREHIEHGKFTRFVEEIGIEYTVATRMMQAAFKFSDDKTLKVIEAAGNKSKLFELMILDDEEIAEINDGGTVAGLELDDIERMTTRELRAKLREAREEQKATDQLLAQKNETNDKLMAQIQKAKTRIEIAPIDEQVTDLTNAVAGLSIMVESHIKVDMRKTITELMELKPNANETLAGYFQNMEQALREVREEFLIAETAPMVPEWAKAVMNKNSNSGEVIDADVVINEE